ncbi:MAG: RICIN domain-containing protein [Caulobacterales bacterium]|nr:RICIN domain-containing protein [Caulobacterales bacterium]
MPMGELWCGRRQGVVAAVAGALASAGMSLCGTAGAFAESGPADPRLADANGYEGRIRLTRFLDEPDGYCLDVPGPVTAPMLDFPMVAHTCHADPLGDQVFRFNMDGAGRMRWMHEGHDLCMTAASAEAGASLPLAACTGEARQSFQYTDRGEFQLKDSPLCIHVERTGPALRDEPAEGQDRYGRGHPVNPQYTHLMRRLELRECGAGDPAMSRWKAIE